VRRRCTRPGALIIFGFMQERLGVYFVFVRLRMLRWFLDNHRLKWGSQPAENRRFHPSIEWPFIVTLFRNVIPILGVSQYQ
jgi:hypothetical protein